MDTRTRLTQAKKYVVENAPAIVTAVAAVALVVITHSQNEEIISFHKDEVRNSKRMASIIGGLRKDGYDFDYYPGVGIWSDQNNENPAP